MSRYHLTTAAIIIGIGVVLVAIYFYAAKETKQVGDWCASKNLAVYQLYHRQVCRDRDTGLLYAPP